MPINQGKSTAACIIILHTTACVHALVQGETEETTPGPRETTVCRKRRQQREETLHYTGSSHRQWLKKIHRQKEKKKDREKKGEKRYIDRKRVNTL